MAVMLPTPALSYALSTCLNFKLLGQAVYNTDLGGFTSGVVLQDLPGALDDASVTEALNLHKIKNRQWAIFKTSAIKGEGLFEGLDW
jgi:hypothetical protein